jgi:ribosomal protein S18 acetylase RimI-like enzyme
MNELRIRPAGPGDVPAVADLWRSVFPHDPPRNEPVRMARRKLARGDGLFWVGEMDGQVVATVLAGYDGVRGWIYHLAVAPDRRRRGLARAMMAEAEDALRALGCPKINLQVRTSNLDVVAFYESIGFRRDEVISLGKLLESSEGDGA